MDTLIKELQEITRRFRPLLSGIEEQIFILKPAPGKWSKKEILGHLTDSAQNNIRRFIVAQYEELPKVIYNQDEWVRIAGYQDYSSEELIHLWTLLNKHLYRILSLLPAEGAKRKCLTTGREPYTVESLTADYNKHLLHHLHQILDLEPVPYP
jgi:hypothetical protein